MINIETININIEKCPKPPYCEVPEEEWRNALLGAQESLSNTDIENWDTDRLWETIYFCATYFCKGMMYAETQPKRACYNWPIY